MYPLATTFEADAASPSHVAAAFDAALVRLPRASGALIFVSGRLGASLPAVAQALLGVTHRPPILLAAGAGVLTERRAIEGRPAAAGLLWSGGSTELVSLHGGTPDDVGQAMFRALADRTARRQPPVLAFARANAFTADSLNPLHDLRQQPCIFGGGAVGQPGVMVVQPDGFISDPPLALAIPKGIGVPHVESASACRLLGPMMEVTYSRGRMIHELNGEPILDVLGTMADSVEGEMALLLAFEQAPPLGFETEIFRSVPPPPDEDDGSGPEEEEEIPFVARAVQGIDPDKGVVEAGSPVPTGTRLTFAVLDPEAARKNIERAANRITRRLSGALPRFAIYTDCAARGSALYGVPGVDVGVIQQALPGVPLVGMQSAFELGASGPGTALHLYTGVLTLFTAAS